MKSCDVKAQMMLLITVGLHTVKNNINKTDHFSYLDIFLELLA